MNIEEAVEVFVTSFAESKSRFYPYKAELIDGLWVMRDDPPKKDPRKSEVVAVGGLPFEIVSKVQRLDVGWHFLCHASPPEEDLSAIKSSYKSLGYRSASTEWFYRHNLEEIPECDLASEVIQVTTQEEMTLHSWGPQKMKLDPRVRQYVLSQGGVTIGMVHSRPCDVHSWVGDLYVREEHRGKGFGRALMTRLLLEDQQAGVKNSILLASKLGSMLYPKLGYEEIGTLQVFTPSKRT